jgi:hypothetical protein
MTSPPDRLLRAAEIRADPDPDRQLILMTAIAASKAAASRGRRSYVPDDIIQAACKPRANCLKPKEIRKNGTSCRPPRFDFAF